MFKRGGKNISNIKDALKIINKNHFFSISILILMINYYVLGETVVNSLIVEIPIIGYLKEKYLILYLQLIISVILILYPLYLLVPNTLELITDTKEYIFPFKIKLNEFKVLIKIFLVTLIIQNNISFIAELSAVLGNTFFFVYFVSLGMNLNFFGKIFVEENIIEIFLEYKFEILILILFNFTYIQSIFILIRNLLEK